MPTPQRSVIFWDVPYGTNTVIDVGNVVIPTANAAAWVVATTANRATSPPSGSLRRAEAIAMTPSDGITPATIELQSTGTIDASISNLGAGTASWVRCSATGTPERVATPAIDDDLIGFCEADGRLHLLFGLVTSAMAGGDISIPAGVDDAVAWSIRQQARTLLQVWQSGGVRAYSLGADAFSDVATSPSGELSPDPATSYDEGHFFARTYFAIALTDESTVTPASHYAALYVQGVADPGATGLYAGKLLTLAQVGQHMNLSCPGASAHTNATHLGGARGCIYQGRTNYRGYAAPSQGVRYVVDANDQLWIDSPGGTQIPIDGGLKPPKTPIVQSSTADRTLTAVEARNTRIVITGAASGAFNLIAPNTADLEYFVTNNNSSQCNFKRAGGVAVAIAAGKSLKVWHNGTDYQQITTAAP